MNVKMGGGIIFTSLHTPSLHTPSPRNPSLTPPYIF